MAEENFENKHGEMPEINLKATNVSTMLEEKFKNYHAEMLTLA